MISFNFRFINVGFVDIKSRRDISRCLTGSPGPKYPDSSDDLSENLSTMLTQAALLCCRKTH